MGKPRILQSLEGTIGQEGSLTSHDQSDIAGGVRWPLLSVVPYSVSMVLGLPHSFMYDIPGNNIYNTYSTLHFYRLGLFDQRGIVVRCCHVCVSMCLRVCKLCGCNNFLTNWATAMKHLQWKHLIEIFDNGIHYL